MFGADRAKVCAPRLVIAMPAKIILAGFGSATLAGSRPDRPLYDVAILGGGRILVPNSVDLDQPESAPSVIAEIREAWGEAAQGPIEALSRAPPYVGQASLDISLEEILTIFRVCDYLRPNPHLGVEGALSPVLNSGNSKNDKARPQTQGHKRRPPSPGIHETCVCGEVGWHDAHFRCGANTANYSPSGGM
jgi:hypothetical protein